MKYSELGPELTAILENFKAINGSARGFELETVMLLALNSRALGLTIATLALENHTLKLQGLEGLRAEMPGIFPEITGENIKSLLDANYETLNRAIHTILMDWTPNLRTEAGNIVKLVFTLFDNLKG